jgi:hypothetical protein
MQTRRLLFVATFYCNLHLSSYKFTIMPLGISLHLSIVQLRIKNPAIELRYHGIM